MLRSVAAVPGIWRASGKELVAFVQICDRLGIDPDWLAAVISYESGWDPAAKNKTSSASGLIQFMADTAAGLGTTTAALRSMSIAQQLPYVERYFKPYIGRMNSLASVYAAVFGPGKGGSNVVAPDSTVIYRSPSIEYVQNAGLDKNPTKGYITKADLASAAQSKLNAASGRRVDVDMEVNVAGMGGASTLLLSAAAGWLVVDWYVRKYGLRWPGTPRALGRAR